MTTNSNGGIIRSGTNGSYTYSVKDNFGDKPVIEVNWFSAARYCNWLHNNKPTGNRNSSTTEDGAYTLIGFPNETSAVARKSGAKYYIPTENEWYKAAFYKGGGTNAGYWLYSTQRSDTPPTCVTANSVGDGPYTPTSSTTTTTTTTTLAP
jgi:formylglycine-generating enzyme required for sulfatase activity